MEQPNTDIQRVAELVARLQARFGAQGVADAAGKGESLRYVMYVRKSTDTADKQQRTIGDQIASCKEYADRFGLRWTELIHEEESAMVSDGRPKFRAMLNAIKAGTFDAILAWAPDRLSRNMKEAGEIIDMLDRGDIKDLKFANGFVFANEPSGKILLGITFVMAKQYSDQHSQNVRNAIHRKTAEGKWAGGRVKHGYYRSTAHYLLPDGENHELIKDVFRLRLEGTPQKDIAAYLIERGYPVQTPHTKHRKLVIDDKFVSDILHDAFYVGAMKFSKQFVNLFDKYDFVPAVSIDDFERLYKSEGEKMGIDLKKILNPRVQIKAALMQQFVTCGRCGKFMSTGITKGKYYFRCDSPKAVFPMHGKSTRAKVVLDALYEFLEHHPLITNAGYKHYVAEMQHILSEQSKEAERELKSLVAQRQHAEERMEDMKELARGAKGDKVLVKEYQADMKASLAKAKELSAQITKLKIEHLNPKEAIATFEEFHELFANLAQLIQKIDSMADLDSIIKKIFMNVTVTDQKVTQITQNSPFRELCVDADSAMVTLRRLPWNQFMEELRMWMQFQEMCLAEM
ncbi:recombinase family protein [Candidatus Uhrbacteria bacterium]|nr:recombinase family protein [Candidatus Uhrbacteria bacterium]